MALGIVPARGDWEYRRFSAFTTLAQGQWQKGELVTLTFGRVPSLFTSSNATLFLGVAMNASLQSLPSGTCLIAIPRPGCTAYIDTLTSEPASNLSFAEAGSIVSANGITSSFSKLATSVWSRVVEIVGPIDSTLSRIEVAFIQNVATVYSTSSDSLMA